MKSGQYTVFSDLIFIKKCYSKLYKLHHMESPGD